MIILLLAIALAQEPEVVADEDLSQADIEWIDKFDSELNNEVELPEIKSINESFSDVPQ